MPDNTSGSVKLSISKHIFTPELSPKSIFIASLVILMLNLLMFNYSFNKAKSEFKGWTGLTHSDSGDELAAINYRFEGVITAMTADDITISSQDKQETFKTYSAVYTVISPMANFEEWPTKIISNNDRSQFKIGDQVNLVVSGDRYDGTSAKDMFALVRVLKIKST